MNSRDLELLSSYLDGQLSPSDATRLESRLKSDGELVSALDDLRAARSLLRKLPKRRAPRNFTLTRKMVGLNPPLPRSYPAFRFVTSVATLLFFFTFGLNTFAPQLAQAPAFGVGGGAEAPAESELFAQQASVATEAPATEAPIFESMPAAPAEPPAATEESVVSAADLAPQATSMPPSEDLARTAETPAEKTGEAGNVGIQNQPQAANEAPRPQPPVPSTWMIVFAIVAMIGSIFMALMRRSSINRWK
jgi:anti-sigma factor RsiW